LIGGPGRAYHFAETTCFALVGLFLLFHRRSASPFSDEIASSPSPAKSYRVLLGLAFACSLVLAVFHAVLDYLAEPFGQWDAWAIWNQRARFIFRAGEFWRDAFAASFPHTDYPLLIPMANVRLWSYLGAERPESPWLLNVLFLLATVAVLTAGVWRLRSSSQGLLAGIVLLGLTLFVTYGSSQYADVPLAFFMLSAASLSMVYDSAASPHCGLLILAGLAAGLAAWTKNEGLLFLVVLAASRGFIGWRCDGGRKVLWEAGCFIGGALPIVAVLVIQKAWLAGGNDLIAEQHPQDILARLVDPARYWLIIKKATSYGYEVAGPFAALLPLSFFALGAAEDNACNRRGIATAFLAILLMLTGYFFVYVLTPKDLAWHLKFSLDRLLLHLIPLGLFTLFLYLATPEELCSPPRS
jgi:hypothetical protein